MEESTFFALPGTPHMRQLTGTMLMALELE